MKCQVSNVERGAWTEFVVRCDPYTQTKYKGACETCKKSNHLNHSKYLLIYVFTWMLCVRAFFPSSLCSIPWNSDWMPVQHHCVHLWMYACMDGFCVNIFDLVVYWKLMSEFTFDIRIWKCCKSSNGWMRNPFPSFAMSIMRGNFTTYRIRWNWCASCSRHIHIHRHTQSIRCNTNLSVMTGRFLRYALDVCLCVCVLFFLSSLCRFHCRYFCRLIFSIRVCVCFFSRRLAALLFRCVALRCAVFCFECYFCRVRLDTFPIISVYLNGYLWMVLYFQTQNTMTTKNQPSPTYPLVFLFLVVSLPLRIWRLM